MRLRRRVCETVAVGRPSTVVLVTNHIRFRRAEKCCRTGDSDYQMGEADSGYPPAISHIFGATTFQLAQRKPRQTWHSDVSLERARLRLSEGSSCDLSMRNGPMKTFDVAHQFHLSRLTELVIIGRRRGRWITGAATEMASTCSEDERIGRP